MKVRYVVDGYNLLFYLCGSSNQPIESLRAKLISLLEQMAPITCTVVFDAHKRVVSSLDQEEMRENRQRFSNIDVIYTHYNQSADQFLQEYFFGLWSQKSGRGTKNKQKKQIILVTSDNALGHSIAALGFHRMKVDEFASRLAKNLTEVKKKKKECSYDKRASVQKEATVSNEKQKLQEKRTSNREKSRGKEDLFLFTERDFESIAALKNKSREDSYSNLPDIADTESWNILFEKEFERYKDQKS